MRVEGPIPRTITRVHVIEASTTTKAKTPTGLAVTTKVHDLGSIEVHPQSPVNHLSGWERENLIGALAYAVADRRLEGVTDVLYTVEGY